MARLFYVADPMCSWCWGFAPVLARLEQSLPPDTAVELVLGGLAPDSDEPMSAETRRYVQGAWEAVERATGARFERAFWERCTPRRSTWPACRAVIAAGDRGRELFERIQRAYYLEARDPSDRATLVELGVELGLEREHFSAAIDAPETQAAQRAHFALRDALGASGFPSLGLQQDGPPRLILRGWSDWPGVRAALAAAGLELG